MIIRLDESMQYFRNADFLEKIYIVCCIACVFVGQSSFAAYVPHMMILLLLLSVLSLGRVGSSYVYLNNRHLLLWFLLFAISLYIGWQSFTIAFEPGRTSVYFRRYILYSMFLLTFTKCDCIYSIIKLAEKYALFAGLTALVETLINGHASGGLYGSYHGAAMMMSVACFMFALDFFYDQTDRAALLKYLFSLLCVVVMAKRMFMLLSVLCMLFAYMIVAERQKTRKLLKYIFIVTILLVVGYIFVPMLRTALVRLFITFSDTDITEASSGRNMLWEMAMEVFSSHKIFGVGFSNFIDYTGAHYANAWAGQYHTHNIYYGILCETGIVGLTLFILLFVVAFFGTIKTLRYARQENARKVEYITIFSLMMQLWCLVYGISGNVIYDANEFFLYVFALLSSTSARFALEDGDYEVYEETEMQCVDELSRGEI